jgi:hypothetical protein
MISTTNTGAFSSFKVKALKNQAFRYIKFKIIFKRFYKKLLRKPYDYYAWNESLNDATLM